MNQSLSPPGSKPGYKARPRGAAGPAVELRPSPRPPSAGQPGAAPVQMPQVEHGVIIPHRPGPSNPLADYEAACLLHTLELAKGDKREAAKILGIGKSTLYRKLKKHGIE